MRLRSLAALLLALAGLATFGGRAHAQGATTGTIRGQATTGEARTPVAGAQVAAVNAETGFRRAVATDARGQYSIPLLPPGTYRVEARGLGYAAVTVPGVAVRANEAATVDLRLATEAVALAGITATADRATVNATQGGVVQTVTPEQVENLPVQGRDFTDFLNLSPLVSPQPGVGTGGQFSVAGARTSGTNVQIDGADANNQFFGENRGSSRTPFAFSLESIKEFQLITNGFDVEYGNYQGGVVNAVTKGGTNRFQGNAFFFFRDQQLTGDDFTGLAPRDYRVQQFGLSVSGPVVKDRLHYFFSVDAQRKDQPVFALESSVLGVPADTIARVLSILEGTYGFPNASGLAGTFSQAEDNVVLFGRVDWTISDAHRLTLRQNYADFEQTNDRLNTDASESITRGGSFQNRSYSTVAELNSVFGGEVFNVLRIQYSDEDRPRPPNQPGGYLPEIRIDSLPAPREDGSVSRVSIFLGGDGVLFRNRLVEDKIQVVDNLSIRAGAHTIKVGTNNIFSSTENTFFLAGNGAYRYPTLARFAANQPSQYSRNVRACEGGYSNNAAGQPVICNDLDVPVAKFDAIEWSVYAQDEWEATDRLRVTPGVRLGGTFFDDHPAQVPALEAAFRRPLSSEPLRSDVVPDFTGVSPRIAFTYDVTGNASTVLRGGVGLLIGRVPAVLAGNVFQTERPLLRIDCRTPTSTIPIFNLEELLAGEAGANNPARCVGGTGPSGQPEHAVFSPDFELPRTLKANLGFQRELGAATRVGADLIWSRTRRNFYVQDLNLRAPAASLPFEDLRPVFVPANRLNASLRGGAALADRALDANFSRVFYNVSDAEARAFTVALELDHRLSERTRFGARYAYNRASDHNSFSCCTSQEGFDEPTAGDPNYIGDDSGDDERGSWGPSDFERRHTFVMDFTWRAPLGIRASGIWRSTSGTPWTPTVDGDINGDGINGNDRVFVDRGHRFAAGDTVAFQGMLNRFECLREQEGRIAARNSCRNPWFHSVDLRLSKEIGTVGRQRAELLVDVFNVLNGLNSDWGRFMGVFGSNQQLLIARSYEVGSGRVTYEVNDAFGEERPVGFDPFQFQVQLGVRYRF